MTRIAPLSLLPLLLLGCIEPLTLEPAPPATPLGVGETRTIELRMLRLDVEGFEQRVDLATLQDLPQSTLEGVWLLDMPLEGLVESSLQLLSDLPVDEAQQLPQAAQNMRELMRLTPDTANLEGTQLEELLSLSAALGIPPAKPLSELFQVGVTERVLPLDLAAQAVVDGLIGTHPGSQTRPGPVDEEHPDGVWTVAENSLPITLYDVVTSFEGLVDKFGPAETEWGTHPGFIEDAQGFTVIEDEFAMTVKVNANALPFSAVDLTSATEASVNSTGSQIETLFATEDPDWMTIQGLVPEPTIELLTVSILESDTFHHAGTTLEPAPLGASTVWDLPPWEIERLIGELAVAQFARLDPVTVTYELATGTDVFEAVLDEAGWLTFETFADIGAPPPPAYLWDGELEIVQVRLHDGGLAEGEADVAFTLEDVGLGVQADDIVADVRDNLTGNPSALRDLASAITENGFGAPDLFYYKPEGGDADWLYFLAPEDIPQDEDGPVRSYDYANPGFFSDPELADKVSATELLDGDESHEKVEIAVGDALYVEDDEGAVFELVVRDKPSENTIALDVTRIR